jgi:hypothetical protein
MVRAPQTGRLLLVISVVLVAIALPAAAQMELKLLLPLNRTAYQTNETIPLCLVRNAPQAIPAGDLSLLLHDEHGGKIKLLFNLPAVPLQDGKATSTEHLALNSRLLRPGRYQLTAATDGTTVRAEIDLFSHVRKSSFRTIVWTQAPPGEQGVLGEDGMGFNMLYNSGFNEPSIRGGMDWMQVCTMGGGHQMDLRMECDWSDPYVIRGGTARAVQAAFKGRTTPNCLGVHFYDEPGLTWHKHPVTGAMTPHGVPAQVRAYRAAFGHDPIAARYDQLKPDDPRQLAEWMHFGRWKTSFLEAAWKDAAFGVSFVRPDYLSANQSVYAWYAYADGYYFNPARPLPVLSGHGGYDDMPAGYLCPSFYLELGRMRDFHKPVWYLPTWYDEITSPRYRLEQYLSFITNIQGLIMPPPIKATGRRSSPRRWTAWSRPIRCSSDSGPSSRRCPCSEAERPSCTRCRSACEPRARTPRTTTTAAVTRGGR